MQAPDSPPTRPADGPASASSADEPGFWGQTAILRDIAEGLPVGEVLERLTLAVEAETDGMRASVLLLQDGHLIHGSAPHLHPDYVAGIDGVAVAPDVGSCGAAAHTGELVIVEDVLVDPKWEPFRELATTCGFRACWSAPILSSDGTVLGTFALYYDEPRAPDPDAIELIRTAARVASLALERDQIQELRTRQRELELAAEYGQKLAGLTRAAVVINSQRSLEEMLSSITAQACEIIGAHLGSTSLTVPGTGAAEGWPQVSISVQLSDKYAAWRDYDAPSRGTPTYGLVCADNDVLRMTDEELKSHPAWRNFAQEQGRHPPMRGWLAAPLVASDGSNLGILQLSDKYDGDFTEADENIVIQLAQMASVAVEKARLYELAAEQRQARVREELLSGLSHDMQTPLATITGLIDVLGQVLPLEDPEHVEAFDALTRQTDHLYGLIQQFLDHLRLQADRGLNLATRPIDPRMPLSRIVELFEHQREIRVEAPDPVPDVLADRVRLQQVLSNLVGNAVKFSGEPITVRLEVGADDVSFHVEDRGVGLARLEDPDVVFERFFRGPEADGTPGAGLGLYVTREVVRAMGGAIRASNRDGGGARFTVTLPRAPAAR